MKKTLLLFIMLLTLPTLAHEYPGGKDFSKYTCTKTIDGKCVQYVTCVYFRSGRCREYERCTLNRRNDDYSCTSTYGQGRYYPRYNLSFYGLHTPPTNHPPKRNSVSFVYTVKEQNSHYYTPSNPGGASSFR